MEVTMQWWDDMDDLWFAFRHRFLDDSPSGRWLLRLPILLLAALLIL